MTVFVDMSSGVSCCCLTWGGEGGGGGTQEGVFGGGRHRSTEVDPQQFLNVRPLWPSFLAPLLLDG